jgi:hypothetical protein
VDGIDETRLQVLTNGGYAAADTHVAIACRRTGAGSAPAPNPSIETPKLRTHTLLTPSRLRPAASLDNAA